MNEPVILSPVMRLAWTCPTCNQLNYHAGKQKIPEAMQEGVEQALEDQRAALRAEGQDPDDLVPVVFPPQVWCCNCGEEFEATPDYGAFL